LLSLMIAGVLTLSACGNGGEKPLFAGLQSEGASETFAPKLRIGYIAPNNKGTITGVEGWAQAKGYLESELKAHGVTEVSIKSFPNGPNLNEALASGALDVGIYGDTPAVNARSVGLKTRLINITQSGMNAWLVGKLDGPQTLEDLKGKKVATADGSYMSRYLNGLLEEAGLAKDVTVVHLLPPDGEPALTRGDIAAYAFPTTFGPLVIGKGYRAIDVAKDHPSLRGSSLTVAREAYLKENPGFAKAWNEIRKRAAEEIRKDPEEYYKLYAEASEFPLEVIKASFDVDQWGIEPFSESSLALLEGTKTFLYEKGIIKNNFDLNDWIYKDE